MGFKSYLITSPLGSSRIMEKKMKFLFVGLRNLKRNYGAQGLALPFIEKLSNHFSAEYTFVLSRIYKGQELSFLKNCIFIKKILSPHPFVILGKRNLLFHLLYLLVKRRRLLDEKAKLFRLVNTLKDVDVVIDLSGIEFIGNLPLKRRYASYLDTISMQWLAEKNDKLYLKYTKSYGPFPDKDKIYRFIVEKYLNKLPFLFVRGENNLRNMTKKLRLKIPLYSFPDISISLEAESKEWALTYVKRLGVDPSRKIVGLSPSTVIARITRKKAITEGSGYGANNIALCKEIIKFYRLNGLQVLLIPHSIDDGKNLRSCDLALVKKIYSELKNKSGIFLFDDMDLTYRQVRAIIGLLDFYVTGRYHSVSSALSMVVPVVALSWHIKYRDLMSLFLDDFLVIDCRTTSIKKAVALIKEYFDNRQWFDKEKVLERKKEIVKEIDRSVIILVNEIKRVREQKDKSMEKITSG
jgi:polysaccharide pyruvyl transferase WcaK-like protein